MANLSNINNKFLVTTGGNVGIGVTGPVGKIHVGLPAYTNEDTNSQQAIFGASNGYGVRVGYNETDNKGYINVLKPGVAWGSLILQEDIGKVGIGTSSPSQLLHLNSSTSNPTGIGLQNSERYYSVRSNNFSLVFTDETVGSERMRINSSGVLNFSNTATSTGTGGSIAHYTNNFMYIRGGTGGLAIGDDGFDTSIYLNNSDDIQFQTGGSEKMRINSSGNVGINYSATGSVVDPVNSKFTVATQPPYNIANSRIEPTTATFFSDKMTNNDYNSILQLVSVRTSLTSGQNSNGYLGFSTLDNSNAQGVIDAGRIAIVNENGVARNSPTALSFWTCTPNGNVDNTPATEKMRIDSSGNVGIGTDSPGTFYPGNHNLVVGDGNGDSAITVYANSANTSYLLFADGTSGGSSYASQVRYNHSTNHMEFATNNSTVAKMTLDDNGNIGIGTTAPSKTLQVSSSATGDLMNILCVNTHDTDGDTASIGFSMVDLNYQKAAVIFERTTTQGRGSLHFATNNVVGNNNVSKGDARMTILSGGDVGIGTAVPTQKLEVTGNFKLNGTTVQEGTGNNLTFKYRTTHSNAYTGGTATCKFGRFYWTPAHWVNVAPVIKVTLHCKYYQGERREYIIKAGYQNTDPIINELQPSSTAQRITLVVGATTSAGYNYANQPVYYVDLQWVQTSYIWGWAQIESQVPFLTSNPTSGWGGVVTDSGLTQTNGGLVIDNNSFFAGNVGVGTETPPAKLSVYAGGADGIQLLDLSDSNNSGRVFYARSGGGSWCIMNNATNYSIRSGGVPGSTSGTEKIRLTGYSATSWTSGSDETIKENIKPIGNVLDKINDYRCVEYNLIDDETKDKKIGFIAQDWQEDFPQIIEQMENEKIGMKYTETIPILLKAIQELKAEIEELKK